MAKQTLLQQYQGAWDAAQEALEIVVGHVVDGVFPVNSDSWRAHMESLRRKWAGRCVEIAANHLTQVATSAVAERDEIEQVGLPMGV
jgi:hypothetical protein